MAEELVAPPHLSPSSIGTFEQCPLKFKFSRIDMISDPPTEATVRGNFVHDVLECMYALPPEERTPPVARRLMRQLWDEKWAEEAHKVVADKDIAKFRWSSWWCVENLWLMEDPEHVVPAGLETEINCIVDGVTIKGFVDRYEKADDDSLVIVDYKTGKTPKPQYSSDKYFQLMVYAAGMRELGFGDASVIRLLFLKDAKILEKNVYEKDYTETVVRIRETKTAIDTMCSEGEFPFRKSVLCGWCSYKRICPAW